MLCSFPLFFQCSNVLTVNPILTKLQALTKRACKGEMRERMANFRKQVEIVNDVNDDKSLPYTAGLNFMSVMTNEEIANMLTLNRVNISRWDAEQDTEKRRVRREKGEMLKQPSSVNWATRGAFPPVKNQKDCGSSWAFSATAALEGNYFIETGDQVSFSDQESLDCAKELKGTGDGCQGGHMTWSYDYVKTVDRLALEKDFNYVAKDRSCNMKDVPNGLKKARVTGWKQLPQSDSSLLEAAANHVISVGIQTMDTPFSTYRTGIYVCQPDKGCNCQVGVDHAVDLVGYGKGYWNVRNSWGARWGDNGYIKMSRDQENICLINTVATIPTFKCRNNQQCDKWDGDDEGEKEDEGDDYDVGDAVKCGSIKHFGGRCVDLDDSESKGAILTDIGCDRQFCLTDKGYVQDKVTNLCLTTSNPNQSGSLITFGACNGAQKWSKTSDGFQVQGGSNCWHPKAGSPKPDNESEILVWSRCDSNRNRMTFKITNNLCWEEISGKKLGKKLEGDDNNQLIEKELDDAKELCLETSGCKGLHYNKKKGYQLCGSNKPKDGKNKDKIFVITDCSKACAAGEQRCDDGECREKCDGDDDDCPPGTTRCSDGNCRHIHMCG